LTEPYFLDRKLSLSGQLFYSEADYLSSDYNQRNYGFSVEARKPINAYMYASLGYRLQDIDIFNVSSAASALVQAQKGSFLESEIFTSLVFDRRDNPLLTRVGQRVSLSPYVAGGFLGGDTQIYGWDLEGSQYFHFKWDTILVLNGELATVNQWGSGNDVPIFDRLFLGGSNNLRGFNFRDVGPKDFTGEPLGGKSMARATVEFTGPIVAKARWAIFYDTGLVNTDAWDFGEHTQTVTRKPGSTKPPFEFDNLASDIGVGVRLDLPIGPIRIDYGFPLQKAGNSGGGKFNFNVGYQF
jgi:outer membrane protein insertion porin family